MKLNIFLFLNLFFLNLPFIHGLKISESILENGYSLWIRYCYIEDSTQRNAYFSYFENAYIPENSPTCKIIKDEIALASAGFFRTNILFRKDTINRHQLKIFLTEKDDPLFQVLEKSNKESYIIQTNSVNRTVHITSLSDAGLLYGTFHLLRLIQNQESIENIYIKETPALDLRMLNQWDNLDGTIERGYSGRSIYKWDELPGGDYNRYKYFAKANASIGINGVSVNNVNANPNILKPDYLEKVKVLADIFRPYNIKVFLSVNFASPMPPSSTPHAFKKWGGIGNLDSNDPLSDEVVAWWQDKVNEIYSIIPDFGGFIVKANSEGMPGPQDYGRTHADGANMFARILKPYKGVVIWRAFVYGNSNEKDRVKQAYQEFKPLDGKFDKNVLLQIKNGPLDFQPSEPPNPLFGALERTNLMPELQITQEYLGHSTYLVYLGEMWKKFFDFDTSYPPKSRSTIADIIKDDRHSITGIAGVSNVGDDQNWTGHHFAQANWFLYGRLAWNPQIDIDLVTREWIKMTWSNEKEAVEKIKIIMDTSWKNFVDLQTPFGLPVTVDQNTHYYPSLSSRNGLYWKANSSGIGYDRTNNGSGFVNQYSDVNANYFDNIDSCPTEYLLFFHFVPWDYKITKNESFRDNFVRKNKESILHLESMVVLWKTLQDQIDFHRHKEVSAKLEKQLEDGQHFHKEFMSFLKNTNNLNK